MTHKAIESRTGTITREQQHGPVSICCSDPHKKSKDPVELQLHSKVYQSSTNCHQGENLAKYLSKTSWSLSYMLIQTCFVRVLFSSLEPCSGSASTFFWVNPSFYDPQFTLHSLCRRHTAPSLLQMTPLGLSEPISSPPSPGPAQSLSLTKIRPRLPQSATNVFRLLSLLDMWTELVTLMMYDDM